MRASRTLLDLHIFHKQVWSQGCSLSSTRCATKTFILLIMPVLTTYPGVYIEEIPSGVHTISGVATSIAAFVGYTQRGRDNRAKLILSFADFEREFGGLASNSELSYGVQQFFTN